MTKRLRDSANGLSKVKAAWVNNKTSKKTDSRIRKSAAVPGNGQFDNKRQYQAILPLGHRLTKLSGGRKPPQMRRIKVTKCIYVKES